VRGLLQDTEKTCSRLRRLLPENEIGLLHYYMHAHVRFSTRLAGTALSRKIVLSAREAKRH